MLRFDAFEALGVACAAFSEKSDGNLARDASDEDLQSFCKACGVAASDLALVSRMHGNRVVVADRPGEFGSVGSLRLGGAAALIGATPGGGSAAWPALGRDLAKTVVTGGETPRSLP